MKSEFKSPLPPHELRFHRDAELQLGCFVGDALAAIALRQNKFREDPEALEAFIQVALREIDANSDDVITVEEVEKWFDSLEEEVEDQ